MRGQDRARSWCRTGREGHERGSTEGLPGAALAKRALALHRGQSEDRASRATRKPEKYCLRAAPQ
eukprot:2899122-Pyramimonas_sp.AAC.1